MSSVEADADAEDAHTDEAGPVSEAKLEEMGLREELLLTVTNAGFGKRSSAYDYRVTRAGRAGHHQYRAGRAQGHGGGRHAAGASGDGRDAGDERGAADPDRGRQRADHRAAGDGGHAVPGRTRASLSRRCSRLWKRWPGWTTPVDELGLPVELAAPELGVTDGLEEGAGDANTEDDSLA